MTTKQLSRNQKVFLATMAQGKYVSRSLTNRTAQSLKRMGHIRYAMMVGWVLTDTGTSEALKHLEILNDEA